MLLAVRHLVHLCAVIGWGASHPPPKSSAQKRPKNCRKKRNSGINALVHTANGL